MPWDNQTAGGAESSIAIKVAHGFVTLAVCRISRSTMFHLPN
jgi:hypothetical protein